MSELVKCAKCGNMFVCETEGDKDIYVFEECDLLCLPCQEELKV